MNKYTKQLLRAIPALGLALTPLALRLLRKRRHLNFSSKVVVITGGSRGLGFVLARQLLDEGAKIALLARDSTELERAAEQLSGWQSRILTVVCDVRDQDDVQRAIDQVVAHYGTIDVLINNAGVIQVGPVEHMQIEDFENAMAVHFYGPLYTTRAVVPYMRRHGGGRIANVSSLGGRVSVPHLMPYSASKFALVGLSDGMRHELAKDNILVSTICPGLMRTGSHYNAQFKGKHEREMIWFSLMASLPLFSTDAESAAKQIIEACRYGDPRLTITPQARIASAVNAFFPELMNAGMRVFELTLPSKDSAEGDTIQTGWQSRSALVPSLITRLNDAATRRYNGMRGHSTVGDPSPSPSVSSTPIVAPSFATDKHK